MFVAAAFLFVVIVLGVTAYALIRPFYLGYRHPQERLWKPLD